MPSVKEHPKSLVIVTILMLHEMFFSLFISCSTDDLVECSIGLTWNSPFLKDHFRNGKIDNLVVVRCGIACTTPPTGVFDILKKLAVCRSVSVSEILCLSLSQFSGTKSWKTQA